ncbi:alpha-L-arabinofuranosidase C-terminal domain-containing protein [Aeoliella mucimassa]|uniref:non-reducing end alpha-L-arabinofuranosidase n=1 Tax=Aeoliella mucimassa TaxID=2527972 RepID=A0A518ALC6_9BACT|nr:alpha-L-arabinofuranosidase C-terminal domain-containing protein [Aeoliella mucimassa]QDU55511.1 Extracellular exo-alpha-L-arabinofuranosidase precursor [Aeoliella mucimassa]
MLGKLTNRLLLGVAACVLATGSVSQSLAVEAEVHVHLDRPSVELSPVLYGLFFEDINYAADGGLYAELVQNRSFEYYPLSNNRRLHPLSAWERVQRDGGTAKLAVVDEAPLNDKNTHYVNIALDGTGTAGIANSGFAGIVLEKDAKYDFSVYARRTEDADKAINVQLVKDDGSVLAEGSIDAVSAEWKKYELTLTASDDATKAKLVVTTTGGGVLSLDMVSLFPQETFKGRKNGMRKDLGQALAELNPKFLRFPGGCIAHGSGLANAYRWKDTVGDVAERKPNWNRWGYHQSYGLGYFEYMQLCEDIGATPLPVVPVGVACGFTRPFDKVPMEDLHIWVDDALDLIEFANGPVESEWGKLRAEMGHPEPFNLEYVCLGNEEHDTPEVRERFPYFVAAIRERYPDIKIVGTSGLGEGIPLYDLMTREQVYSSDEHYYMNPNWYLSNTRRFDSFDRNKPKIFVGEYASEGNSMFNAMAEAAYLTGIERNADIVDMTCYAPLLAKYNYTQWPKADLIWFDNTQVVRTPNYYVQQMFATNKGDVYLDNSVEMARNVVDKRYAGRVGIGTWLTTIEVESAKLNGKPLNFADWEVLGGDYDNTKSAYFQRDVRAEPAMSLAPESADGSKTVYEVRARKTGGEEGFLLAFGYDDGHYYWWNIGGWGNTQHGIEVRQNGQSTDRLVTTRGSIESNRWYDLKVELDGGRIRCYIDGKLIHDFQAMSPELCVSPTMDRSNSEVMVKLVNPSDEPVETTVVLQGGRLADEATLTTIDGPAGAVNTRESEAVQPVVTELKAARTMKLELPPISVQVLKVKLK